MLQIWETHSLFIFSFDYEANMKKYIQFTAVILFLIIAVVFINQIMQYVLVDDADDEIRYYMNELYKQDNIEILFLGSSHVFCGYNPEVLEEYYGENVYLAATPVQKIDASYYLLKEALKTNPIKTVYIDMYYRQFRDVPAERTDEQMKYIWCISDNMKQNWNRVEFLLNASSSDRYINGFLPASRYGNYLLDLSRFERVIKSKRTAEYREVKCPEGIENSFYKGALIDLNGASGVPMIGKIGRYDIAKIGNNIMSDYSLKYLNKMLKLCRDNSIELVLVTTPFTYYHIQAMEDYITYYEFVSDYARQNGLEYYDFNLCKESVLPLEEDMFVDIHHLSGKGATFYSDVFGNMMINQDAERRSRNFYNTIDEKMSSLPQQIFGIVLEENKNNPGQYEIRAVANYNVDAEYRITMVDENGEELRVIQEYSGHNILSLEETEEKTYKIEVREKGQSIPAREGTITLS